MVLEIFNPPLNARITGNTSGTTSLISTGTLFLAGGNNITLSQDQNTITISGGAGGAAGSNTLGMSNLGNTSGTSGVVSGSAIRLLFAGGNNITLSQSLDAGNLSGTVTISAFNQTEQTQNRFDMTLAGNSTSAGAGFILISSGTATIAGGNNITLSQNGNALTISAFNQTGTIPVVSNAIQDVNTATNSGTATSQFAAHDHAHRGQAGWDVNGIASTFYGTQQLSAGNLMSIATGGNSTRGSAQFINVLSSATTVSEVATANAIGAMASRFALEGHQHRGQIGMDVNGIASTFYGTVQASAGNLMSIATGGASTRGSLQFINLLSSATTVSSVATANAIGAMASRFALEGHQHAGVGRIGVSTLGNTIGSTTLLHGASVYLAGGNNITLSQSTDAGNNITITFSGGAGGAGNFSAGMSNLGNTSGTSGTVSNLLVLAGGNNITLSQSVNGQSATVTISGAAGGGGAAPTLSMWMNDQGTSTSGFGTSNATFWVFPLNPVNNIFPGNMTASTAFFGMSGSVTATASSSSHTFRVSIGIYTISASSTLNLINSVSTSWSRAAATSNSANYHGFRWLTIHSSQWSSAPAFSETQYFVGMWIRSSNIAIPMSWAGFRFLTSLQRSGTIGVSSATSTTQGWYPFMGASGASFTTAIPTSIHITALNKVHAMAGNIPHIHFNNLLSRF